MASHSKEVLFYSGKTIEGVITYKYLGVKRYTDGVFKTSVSDLAKGNERSQLSYLTYLSTCNQLSTKVLIDKVNKGNKGCLKKYTKLIKSNLKLIL